MDKFKFWEDFIPEHKKIFFGLIAVLTAVFVYMLWFWSLGNSSVIGWNTMLFNEPVQFLIDSIQNYPFSLNVEVESLVFTEYFSGSAFTVNPETGYVFLAAFTVAWSVFMAISTYLPRFWFYFTSLLVILAIILMKLDLLITWGNQWRLATVISLIFNLGAAYFFHSFRTSVSLSLRFFTFLLVSVLLGMIFFFSGNVQFLTSHLVSYVFPVALIMTLVTILLVAHEVLVLFMALLSSQPKNPVVNWKHFYFISFVYLINVLLVLLHELDVIDWRLLPVNAIVLFVISYFIGIWTYKQREPQYRYLIPFRPLGALFYLSAGLVSFATIGYLSGTANDPGLEVVKDTVIYSQLGFGFVFLMYIASNFLPVFSKGLPVYRILYQPQTMPYFTFRFAGLIAFLALVFMENWEVPVNQGFSAYYNSLGDLSYQSKDEVSAVGYYKRARHYSNNNHRSNYALAQIAIDNKEFSDAMGYYENSMYMNPSPYATINLSNMYINQNRYFDGFFALKRGLKEFPDEPHMLNNMGMLFAQSKTYDSALIYLNRAAESRKIREVAQGNMLAVLGMTESGITPDQLNLQYSNSDVFLNNIVTWANLRNEPVNEKFHLQDTVLNDISGVYAYNYLINNLYSTDTSDYPLFKKLDMGTMQNKRQMEFALALNYYYKGKVKAAIDLLLNNISGTPEWNNKVNLILGKWYFEQGNMKQAELYFRLSENNEEASLFRTMALTLMGEREEALESWESLSLSADIPTRQLAMKINKILSMEVHDVFSELNDQEKLQWCIFNPSDDRSEVIESITDINYRAMALLSDVKNLYQADQSAKALKIIESMNANALNDVVKNELMQWKIKLMIALDDSRVMNEKDQQNISNENLKLTFEVYKAMKSGEQETVKRLMNSIGLNPFDVEQTILKMVYFEDSEDFDQAYNTIQQSVMYNPGAVRLKKAYVRYCGRHGMKSFGISALEDIESEMDSADFEKLKSDFDSALLEWESAF